RRDRDLLLPIAGTHREGKRSGDERARGIATSISELDAAAIAERSSARQSRFDHVIACAHEQAQIVARAAIPRHAIARRNTKRMHRQPDVGFVEVYPAEVGRGDADDRHRPLVDDDRLADGIAASVECRLPEVIADDDAGARPVDAILLRREETPDLRPNTEQL